MQSSKKLCLIVLFLVAGFLGGCSTGVREPSETEQEIHAFLDTYEDAWKRLSRADLAEYVTNVNDVVRITHPDFLALAALYQFPYETGIDNAGDSIQTNEDDWHRAQVATFSYIVVKVENFKLSNRQIIVNDDLAVIQAKQTMQLIKSDDHADLTTTSANVSLRLQKVTGAWKVVGEYTSSS